MFPGSNRFVNGGGKSIDYANVTSIVGNDFAVPMTKANRNLITTPGDGLMVIQTDATPGKRCFSNGGWVRYTETADP